GDRSGDLEALAKRGRTEGKAVAPRIVAHRRRSGRRLGVEPAAGRKKIFGPACAGERPFVFGAQYELLARMADVERHPRLLIPAGVLALEEMAEEAFLQLLAVTAVEVREMCVAMRFQPFLRRAGAHKALEITARVQPHAAPVGGGQ